MCVGGGGCAGAENHFKKQKAHRQSVDSASSCPTHGRIEFEMISLIFSWHAAIKTAAIRR